MAQISRQGDGFEVSAGLIAEGLRLPEDAVAGLMRSGAITSRCERGEGEDAGKWRLSFLHAGRTFRLTVTDSCELLSRSTFDSARRR